MNEIYLYRNNWTNFLIDNLEINVIGWAEFQNSIIKNNNWLDVCKQIDLQSISKFSSFISSLNGNFTIIINDSKFSYIGTDRMRGYQIHYFNDNGKWVLTDDIIKFRDSSEKDLKLDPLICEQYMVSDYVFGPNTVFENVQSIQAGETVKLNYGQKQAERNQYFQWTPNMERSRDLYDISEEASKQDEILLRVFRRMIKSAPEVNNWLVPLSGGYDSRTIVNYLYKLGVKNVICFSYGIKENIQSQISKKVAESLKFKWYFVDFTEWLDSLHETNHIASYLQYGFNGSSAAALSGLPAVYALKKRGIIHSRDIFVPGHALEVLAGNHLEEAMLSADSPSKVLPLIKKHFSGFGHYKYKRTAVLKQVINIISNYSDLNPVQIAECFDWKERQTKYIANTVKIYEYFGYGWRIPEWDNDLIQHWSQIGFDSRYKRNMYKNIFKQFLAVEEIKDLPFANDILQNNEKNKKKHPLDSIKTRLKFFAWAIGFRKKSIYINPNEGYHLILKHYKGNVSEYISTAKLPENLNKYLTAYSPSQKMSDMYINSLITLLVLKMLFTSQKKIN